MHGGGGLACACGTPADADGAAMIANAQMSPATQSAFCDT
jgi:hypothetical protein